MKTVPTPLAAARIYVERGWAVVPVPYRHKGPLIDGWQRLRLVADDLDGHFGEQPSNIGVLLGDASGGLVDIDLDCPESVALADLFLPVTKAEFGRASKRRSHRLFVAVDAGRSQQFKSPDGTMLVELRANGVQTVFPPSVHPSGEAVEWDKDGEPSQVSAKDLFDRVRELAAASLLARHWPKQGGRHDAALALAGALVRGGWDSERVRHFIHTVAIGANDEEAESRATAAESTVHALDEGREVTGLPRLEELIGSGVTKLITKWLDLRSGGATRAPGRSKPRRPRPPPYQPFPLDHLPHPVRRFVRTVSEALGCDPAFVILPLLAALASAVGNARRIRLKRSWAEPLILWALLIAASGTLKSPAQESALRAVRELQRRALRAHGEARARYELDLQQYEKELAAWKRDPESKVQPTKPEGPVSARHWCSDTTLEALADLLQDQPRGLLAIHDELSGWFRSFNAYRSGRGSDEAHWLEIHRGGALLVDRKTGNSRVIYVPRAAVSICGGIQPHTLSRVLGKDNIENGMAARFLMALPPRTTKQWSDADVPAEADEEIANLFAALYALEPGRDRDGELVPIDLELTAGAKSKWIAFYNEHAQEQSALDGDLSAAWSKLEGYAARLTLLVHCVRVAAQDPFVGDEVDEASIEAGIAMSRWFGQEAKRVYAVLAESEDERRVRQLVELIEAKGGEVKLRDWQRARAHQTVEAAEAQLDELVELGLGAWEHPRPSSKGGRPSRVFRLTPEPQTSAADVQEGVSSVSEEGGPPNDNANSIEDAPVRPEGSEGAAASDEVLHADYRPESGGQSDTDETPLGVTLSGVCPPNLTANGDASDSRGELSSDGGSR